MIHATRYHDISCGHRVVGHEGKCKRLHGHGYRIHFTCTMKLTEGKPPLDDVGRVIDFSVIKEKLCQWLEDNWDHKFLMWYEDPLLEKMQGLDPDSIAVTSFNPTAENIAIHLVEVVGRELLQGTDVILTRCIVEETRKCSAEVELGFYH